MIGHLETGAVIESLAKLHPALVVEAVELLDDLPHEGGVGQRPVWVVLRALPPVGLQVVLVGRAGRPVEVAGIITHPFWSIITNISGVEAQFLGFYPLVSLCGFDSSF